MIIIIIIIQAVGMKSVAFKSHTRNESDTLYTTKVGAEAMQTKMGVPASVLAMCKTCGHVIDVQALKENGTGTKSNARGVPPDVVRGSRWINSSTGKKTIIKLLESIRSTRGVQRKHSHYTKIPRQL